MYNTVNEKKTKRGNIIYPKQTRKIHTIGNRKQILKQFITDKIKEIKATKAIKICSSIKDNMDTHQIIIRQNQRQT